MRAAALTTPVAERGTTGGTTPLRADELYRFYRSGDEETRALRGVSVEVRAGEILAVTGPSGSGKSTLLACLAGLDEPSGGAVWLASLRLSHRPEAERALLRREHLGVLYQHGNLIDHLSVTDNIRLARSLIGTRPTRPIEALLEDVGLTARAGGRPGELSGGDAARAGLAGALANDPVVLLADEPTGEVDGDTESRLLRLLRDRADRGLAVVVVTHSSAVAGAADRLLRMSDGRVAG